MKIERRRYKHIREKEKRNILDKKVKNKIICERQSKRERKKERMNERKKERKKEREVERERERKNE